MVFRTHFSQRLFIIFVVIFKLNLNTGGTTLHICLDDLILLNDRKVGNIALFERLAQVGIFAVNQSKLLVNSLLLL